MSSPDADFDIGRLFSHSRFPSCKLKLFSLCLYAPVGLLLALLRLFLGLHVFAVSCLLRKSSKIRCVVLRIMCTLLGIVVVEDGYQDASVKVVVSNHVSALDFTALGLLRPCVLPSVWDLPGLLMWCLGYADLGARRGRAALIEKAREFCRLSDLPVLAFPEGGMTSGKEGLLKFDSWPFALRQPVQPVALSASRPSSCDLSLSTLGSRWWTDLLWTLFAPYTLYRVKWLRRVSLEEEETPEALAERTAEKVAAASGLRLTSYTSHDAVEYAKRRLVEEERERERARAIRQQRQTSAVGKSAIELDSLAFKVKEMLPQVPLHVIRKDLERTGSVEATSSNILEGRLPYTPESPDSASGRKQRAPPSDRPGDWKEVYERRKWELIEENRRKYLVRKGLLAT